LPPSAEFVSRRSFYSRGGNESFALRLFARELACAADCLRSLPCRAFGGFLVELPSLHLSENTFTLHFLLEDSESLIDIVVANEYLQGKHPFIGFKGISGGNNRRSRRELYAVG